MNIDLKISFLDEIDVTSFIKKFDNKYKKKLSNYFNYPRVVSLADLYKLLDVLEINFFSKVAVISGSFNEPELNLINYKHLDILDFNEVSNLFNLDNDWEMFNEFNKSNPKTYKKGEWDFVFCNQVLEHIFSPLQAMKNIHYIMKKNGYAWISIPTINRIHGEPYFYSAGYHPRYLYRLIKEFGFEVIHLGAWGNRKYLSYAVQGKWLTHDQLKKGFRSQFDFANPYFAMKDGRKTYKSGKFITDTWALIKKIND